MTMMTVLACPVDAISLIFLFLFGPCYIYYQSTESRSRVVLGKMWDIKRIIFILVTGPAATVRLQYRYIGKISHVRRNELYYLYIHMYIHTYPHTYFIHTKVGTCIHSRVRTGKVTYDVICKIRWLFFFFFWRKGSCFFVWFSFGKRYGRGDICSSLPPRI